LICDGSNWIVEDYNITIMSQHSLGGDQTVENNVVTTIIPASSHWDWGGGFNTSTGIWTAPAASSGYYEVGIMIQLALTGFTAEAYISIFTGATEVARWRWNSLTPATGTGMRKIILVESGETVLMKAFQYNAGASDTVANSGFASTWLSVTLIPGTLKWA
jgi:hypothetical protein